MLSPTETPFPIRAPRFAASMIPGPPPEMMANPRRASISATLRAVLYDPSPLSARALPKIVMAGPRSLRVSNPSTNSLMIRKTRHVSPLPNSSIVIPPVCSCKPVPDAGAASFSRESPEEARLHLLRQQGFFYRGETDDDPGHRAKGGVVEPVEVVEQKILELPPLDRQNDRPLP